MKNYKKHIDDFFREKLGRYTETPPEDVWDSLDARLDTLKPGMTGPNPTKWMWHAAAMVSLVVVLSVSLTRKFTGSTATDAANNKDQVAQVNPAQANELKTEPSTEAPQTTDVNAVPVKAETEGDAAANNAQSAGSAAGKGSVATTSKIAAKPISVSPKHVKGLKQTGTKAYSSAAGGNSNTASAQPENVYNSAPQSNHPAVAQPAEKGAATSVTNETSANQNSQKIAEPVKKDLSASDKNIASKPVAPKHKLPVDFKRWEAGVKGGYERGFDNVAANKFVVSPYIQYNLSPKFAIMTQPAVKYATAPTKKIGADQRYYQSGNANIKQNGASIKVPYSDGGVTTYTYWTSYTITETHDSVVKSNTYGGSYMEYELPVMVRYNISKNVSVYGGVNVIFSQVKGVTEHTTTINGITTRIDTTLKTVDRPAALPDANNFIPHNGSPYTDYNGPLYPTAPENQVRFGATIGFSYEYSKRWLLDALIQKNPAKADVRGGYNINTPLSSTYFRLSVGYKLTK